MNEVNNMPKENEAADDKLEHPAFLYIGVKIIPPPIPNPLIIPPTILFTII